MRKCASTSFLCSDCIHFVLLGTLDIHTHTVIWIYNLVVPGFESVATSLIISQNVFFFLSRVSITVEYL